MGFGAVEDFLDFMPDTVLVDKYVSTAVNGVFRYASEDGVTPSAYPARIEMKNRIAVDMTGREVVSRGRVYLGTSVAPDVKDKIILPAIYTPQTPPVISVNPTNDESGTHHITIEIG